VAYRFSRLLAVAVLALAMAGAAITNPPKARKPPPPLKTSALVRRWMRGMTLRDKVAQLIFIPFYNPSLHTQSSEYAKFVRRVRDTKIGGLILLNFSNGRTTQRAEPYALGAFINRMQRLARVPLIVSADFERGASMRVDGSTLWPHAMAFGAAGDPSLTRREGEVTAREARALGIQWVFYPVADVNSNPDNPIINIRSFGENPDAVAANVKAFIEGAHSDKNHFILTTAKHFPGHGDTAVDSHLNLPVVQADRDRLDKVELVPFRAAIAAGVDAIMTAHLAVPALAPPGIPATLSPAILTDVLRSQLNFNGLVITDALDMGGIAGGYSPGEAAVKALQAGADTLLMPADPDAALNAVMAAVRDGRLSERRIDESVARILTAKERLGLDRRRFVDLEAIGDTINSPEANQQAQLVADRAVTLVRNNDGLVPLAAPDRACYVVMPESRYSSEGVSFLQELRKRLPKASVATLDPSMSRDELDDALKQLPACDSYVVAVFSQSAAYRGSLALGGNLDHALETITSSGKPVALVALGNPYLLRSFPNVAAYLATFSTVPTSETAAVKALFGEIDITGKLPVTIPGLAQYGEGIQLPARRPPQVTSAKP
jgi:beta-N-acetylhexosaminidase